MFGVVVAGSVYAKYYFALRSMSEQPNFRQRYMVMISVGPSVKRIEVSMSSCVLLLLSSNCCAERRCVCLLYTYPQESSNVLKNQLYSRSV